MGSLGGFRAQSYICAGGGCRFLGFGLSGSRSQVFRLTFWFWVSTTHIQTLHHTYIHTYIHIYMYILTLPVATNEQEDECFRPEG